MHKNEIDDYNWTSNSSVYNKLRKLSLEQLGEIHCGYCPYHKGENNTNKWYGTNFNINSGKKMKYPSWKLVSKNRKQWMKKKLKTIQFKGRYFNNVEIII